MFTKLTPNIMVKDVNAAVEFYTGVLGFDFGMGVLSADNSIVQEYSKTGTLTFATINQNGIEIMIELEKSFLEDSPQFKQKQVGASVSFYFETKGLDELYGKIKEKITIVKDMFVTWYGMKEFYILDNNGYVLGFAEATNG